MFGHESKITHSTWAATAWVHFLRKAAGERLAAQAPFGVSQFFADRTEKCRHDSGPGAKNALHPVIALVGDEDGRHTNVIVHENPNDLALKAFHGFLLYSYNNRSGFSGVIL